MEINAIEIDLADLATVVLDNVPILVKNSDIFFTHSSLNEMHEYIDDYISSKIPYNMIIKDACKQHLIEDLNTVMKDMIHMRSSGFISMFGRDEKSVIENKTFEVEVEKDGY